MFKYLVILSLVFLVLFGCKKDSPLLFSKKYRLTKKEWRIKTFINTESNTVVKSGALLYKFDSNGDYIVTNQKQELFYSTWEFIDNGEYIRIGSNVFKVKILSDRLFGVRYGEIEIFYIPVN